MRQKFASNGLTFRKIRETFAKLPEYYNNFKKGVDFASGKVNQVKKLSDGLGGNKRVDKIFDVSNKSVNRINEFDRALKTSGILTA